MSRYAAAAVLMLILNGCGGGGSRGVSASSTPPPPVSGLIPAGTFLSGPGAAYSGPEASMDFNGGTTSNQTSSAGAANVTLTNDPTTGTARFLTVNVPSGSGSYSHTFDLKNSQVGTGPFAGLIGVLEGTQFSDGSHQHEIVLDPNLNYATYGLWVNIQSVTLTGVETGATGAFAIGQLTPAAAIPTSGSATYVGTTIGAAVNGTTSILLNGTVNLTATFGTNAQVNGTIALNNATAGGSQWATLNLNSAAIAAGNGGSYSGPLSGTLNGGGTLNGTANGNFYGPHVNETAGTWSVNDGGSTHALGSFGAKKQ